MKQVSGRAIKGESVTLDDHSFANCIIADSEIHYNGGEFLLTETTIVRPNFVFEGAAERTLQAMIQLGLTVEEFSGS